MGKWIMNGSVLRKKGWRDGAQDGMNPWKRNRGRATHLKRKRK